MPICLCPTLKEIASPCPWDQGQAPHCIGTAQPLYPLLPVSITDVQTPQVFLLGVAPSPSASLCWAKLPFSGVSLNLALLFSRLSCLPQSRSRTPFSDHCVFPVKVQLFRSTE